MGISSLTFQQLRVHTHSSPSEPFHVWFGIPPLARARATVREALAAMGLLPEEG
jgi:hypothetical protein